MPHKSSSGSCGPLSFVTSCSCVGNSVLLQTMPLLLVQVDSDAILAVLLFPLGGVSSVMLHEPYVFLLLFLATWSGSDVLLLFDKLLLLKCSSPIRCFKVPSTRSNVGKTEQTKSNSCVFSAAATFLHSSCLSSLAAYGFDGTSSHSSLRTLAERLRLDSSIAWSKDFAAAIIEPPAHVTNAEMMLKSPAEWWLLEKASITATQPGVEYQLLRFK